MTNDQWAERKGYSRFLAGSDANGYLFENDSPTAKQLDATRSDAHAMIERRIGSTGTTDTDFLLSLEYRLVESLRMYEVAIKRGELQLLITTMNQILSLIPSDLAQDIGLDTEDNVLNRGTTSG